MLPSARSMSYWISAPEAPPQRMRPSPRGVLTISPMRKRNTVSAPASSKAIMPCFQWVLNGPIPCTCTTAGSGEYANIMVPAGAKA